MSAEREQGNSSGRETERGKAARRTHEGPSWGLMLAAIALAMLVALAIAWAFIHPLMHPHHGVVR